MNNTQKWIGSDIYGLLYILLFFVLLHYTQMIGSDIYGLLYILLFFVLLHYTQMIHWSALCKCLFASVFFITLSVVPIIYKLLYIFGSTLLSFVVANIFIWRGFINSYKANVFGYSGVLCWLNNTYRIKPEELYIPSCGKGRGRRPSYFPQLRV